MFDITKIFMLYEIVYGVTDGYKNHYAILDLVENIYQMKNEPEWLEEVAKAIISVDVEEREFWNKIAEICYKFGNDSECPNQILDWMFELTKVKFNEYVRYMGYGYLSYR